MQKIKHALIVIAASMGLFTALSPQLAAAPNCANPATPQEAVQCGSCGAAGQSACEPQAATKSINDTIKSIVNVLSAVIGVIAVIVIILAGFRYITSAGNEQSIAAAKKTLLYAIVGLVIVALAQLIVRFVLGSVK